MKTNAVVIGILFVVVFIVGFFLGRFSVGTEADVAIDNLTETIGQQPAQNTGGENVQNVSDEPQTSEGTTINTSQLTESQRNMLRSLGIDADNIVITAEMVACAEAKIGTARLQEIKNGATPSFGEGATLIACYR